MSKLAAGNFVIILTPFKDDGEIDFNGLSAELEYAISKKLQGAVILGSGSEGPYLTAEEKVKIIKRTSEVCEGRIQLVAGAITMGSKESLEYASLAKAAGFDSLMSAITIYHHLGFEDVKLHYKFLARNSPLPVTLYHVPECTGLVLNPAQVAEIASISGVSAMKLTVLNREFIEETIRLCKDSDSDCQIYIGTSLLAFEALKLGANGVFCPLSLVAPDDCNAVFNLYQAGDFQKALQIQGRVRRAGAVLYGGSELGYEVMENLFMGFYNTPFDYAAKCSMRIRHAPPSYIMLKEVLRLKGLPITNNVRMPYLRADRKKSEWIKRVLIDFNWLKL